MLKATLPTIFLLLALFCSPPTPAAAEQLRELTDPTGRPVLLPATPRRVVSLAPSITEMIFALGREEILQATTQFSNYPAAAKELPRIGSYVHPDLELIVAHRPDLVLAIRDGNPRQLIERLEKLGIPVFAIDPRNLAEIKTSLLALGEALNAGEEAAAIVEGMAARLELIDDRVATADHRPLVFFQIDAEPLVSIGEQSFLNELIIRAGGRNATAAGPIYPRLGWEQILRLQPEVVIITSMAGGQSPEQLRQNWQRWPQLIAVQNRRLHVVDADLFDRPTQRLVDGLEILAALIQPQLFSRSPQP